jgi:methylenetetrahydrofolate reductase (NADPH)
MRIDRLFGLGLPTLSFEFFPPKTEEGFVSLFKTIEDLRPIQPTYVSVTYGAGGSTRAKTVQLTERIQREIGMRAMAHLTCVGHTADEIGNILDELWTNGIRNVLALRGDPPAGQNQFVATPGGFGYAVELIRYMRSRKDFCIGAAGYPEGHPQCLNKTRDLEHLKAKVDAGANFIITQLFFDNAEFYRFRDTARSIGINVPIMAGIMPITNLAQIKRFISMCGAKIPHPLLLKLERIEHDPDSVATMGVEYATHQCQDLLDNQVDGVHFYTLNKSKATVQVCKGLHVKHAS